MVNTDQGQLITWNLHWDETDEPVAPQIYREQASLKRDQFVSGGDIWTVADD